MPVQTISTTRSDLEAQAAQLVHNLGGTWRPQGAMCGCPAHDDREPSLSVRVGSSSLLFKCFAGCDGSDIIRAIRDKRVLSGTHILSRPPTADDPSDSQWRAAKALEIWDRARPLAATPGLRYLQERGLTPPCDQLRYLSATPCGPKGKVTFRPAVIAPVRDDRGFRAIQRTFLDPARPAKATDLPKAKMGLGAYGAGAVRLYPATDELGIAEGIETAIAAHHLFGIPVWAVLGTERFPLVQIPAGVRHLVLFPDAGKGGERAAAQARDAHERRGMTIDTEMPIRGDWNDVLLDRLRLDASRRKAGRAGEGRGREASEPA